MPFSLDVSRSRSCGRAAFVPDLQALRDGRNGVNARSPRPRPATHGADEPRGLLGAACPLVACICLGDAAIWPQALAAWGAWGAWGVGRGAWGVGRGAWGVGRGAWGVQTASCFGSSSAGLSACPSRIPRRRIGALCCQLPPTPATSRAATPPSNSCGLLGSLDVVHASLTATPGCWLTDFLAQIQAVSGSHHLNLGGDCPILAIALCAAPAWSAGALDQATAVSSTLAMSSTVRPWLRLCSMASSKSVRASGPAV